MAHMNAVVMNNLLYVTAAFGFIILILSFVIISLKMDLSDLKRRYKKMMAGADGENLERMLARLVEDTDKLSEDNRKIRDKLSRNENLLERAVTRVAVVRFDAFNDTSAELSYSIALLDEKNNGVIISTINGRESMRSYAKPIINGTSPQFKLTAEEDQALREAAVPPSIRDK